MVIAGWIALLLAADPGPAAVEIQAVRPDVQLERLLNLFEGTGEANPAEVLARWRRAAGEHGPKPPGKGWQAILAMLNPGMIREFRDLDGLTAWVEPPRDGDGVWDWSLVVPHDDGTISGFATALALTDGAAGPPIEGMQTDRLGGPASPWMARVGETVVVSRHRNGLAQGRKRGNAIPKNQIRPSGYYARVDFEALGNSPDPDARRWGDILRQVGIRDLRVRSGIEHDSLRVVIRSRLNHNVTGPAGNIDPAWLDFVPAQASAAFSWAMEPSGATWDRGFLAVDRYLQTGDAEPRPAPARVRLNLLANLAGVRPEVDLWPHLQGISGFVIASDDGQIEKAALLLHADSEDSANNLADRVIPRLLKALGQSVELRAEETTVILGWNERSVTSAVEAKRDPLHSAGLVIRSTWNNREVSRCGALWPGRWPGWIQEPTLQSALLDTPPIVWCGRREGRDEVDRLDWPLLAQTVARWVDAVPGKRPAPEQAKGVSPVSP